MAESMTKPDAAAELERVVGALLHDDIAQDQARFNHWLIGSVLGFGERRELEQRRDECLKVLTNG